VKKAGALYNEDMSKGQRAPYRALTIPERDLLFAVYEKHSSNMLAMTRDVLCQFKSYAQLKYYCDLYNFYPRYVEIRRKQADAVLAGLKDSKALAIQQAIRMLEPRQVALKDRYGNAITVADEPVFETIYPDQKEVKTAWEIIKTEMGEPTTIGKQDITSKGEAITSIKVNVVNGTGPASNGGIQPQPPEQEAHQSEPRGDR
jgi:hypothetical protein